MCHFSIFNGLHAKYEKRISDIFYRIKSIDKYQLPTFKVRI